MDGKSVTTVVGGGFGFAIPIFNGGEEEQLIHIVRVIAKMTVGNVVRMIGKILMSAGGVKEGLMLHDVCQRQWCTRQALLAQKWREEHRHNHKSHNSS